MIITKIWKNKICFKPPTKQHQISNFASTVQVSWRFPPLTFIGNVNPINCSLQPGERRSLYLVYPARNASSSNVHISTVYVPEKIQVSPLTWVQSPSGSEIDMFFPPMGTPPSNGWDPPSLEKLGLNLFSRLPALLKPQAREPTRIFCGNFLHGSSIIHICVYIII